MMFSFSTSLRLFVSAVTLSVTISSQTLAPGGPGKDAQWMTAAKQAIGTSATSTSKVWFTLANGVLSEVYYPDVTTANVQMLQFLTVDGGGHTETESGDTQHEIKVFQNDSPTFQQVNIAKSGKWKIVKIYAVDPDLNTILIDVTADRTIEYRDVGFLQLYVYFDPSLRNSGMHDTAWTQDGALLATDGNISSALIMYDPEKSSGNGDLGYNGFQYTNNGFLGTSGGPDYISRQAQDFYKHPNRGSDLRDYPRAQDGNVVQTGSIPVPFEQAKLKSKHFVLALSFAENPNAALQNAKASLKKGFERCLAEYEKGWSDYVETLPKVDPKYQPQFNMAAMLLKAMEDKSHPGANIASLSIPWGGGANANENNVGGYHLVWSRDLYQVATAYLATGDKAAANRALDFLFNVQQKPDGSFPQNSWLDGKPFWNSLQMDEVAYPLILAYQLGRNDKATYENHVKKAADFVVKNGPATPQERWEEESGYSPSTIAAEIAGLVCAADIAQKNGDRENADRWLKTADNWQANIEKWTATTSGKYGDGNYYLRITQNRRPNAGDKIELNNGAGTFDERDIVDAGFLELVRLGVKSANDPLIEKSVKVVDQVLKVDTPNGPAFYRYNHDGYGEEYDGRRWNWDGKYSGKGHLWTLLTGERGEYELARHEEYSRIINKGRMCANGRPCPPVKPNADFYFAAKRRLDAILGFANDGLMIPEQIWDKPETPKIVDHQFVSDLRFGEGTGSATPLAWSMAQFIRLAMNLKAGRNLETPQVVYDRYVLGKKTQFK